MRAAWWRKNTQGVRPCCSQVVRWQGNVGEQCVWAGVRREVYMAGGPSGTFARQSGCASGRAKRQGSALMGMNVACSTQA